ncbi:MAG: methyltransferase domain-containing protein [Selenomonadaceae bacterium]|nr:methyltransferase domain-containing protein [Selenomonadaceae bacterium]
MLESRGMLKLIAPSPMPLRVLMVESLSYVGELRSILPSASITVVTCDRYAPIEFEELDLDWIVDDWNRTSLPFDDGSFDLIVGEDFFTLAHEPYDTLRDFGRLLTDVGELVTQYENVRFVGVLEQLRLGFYPERRRRLYAKPEVVRLLNDALFKQINFTPESSSNAPIDHWLDFGFDNFSDDLRVKTWLIRAGRSTAEVMALKQCFTPKIRAELSRLIHRIEYDIEQQENFARLFELCDREMIFDDYLSDFIKSVVAHAERLEIFEREAAARGIDLNFD